MFYNQKNKISWIYRRLKYFYYLMLGLQPHLRLNKNHSNFTFKRFGSKHGGWFVVDSDDLYGSLLISCGLGEDASFDIDFASTYGAKVIIVDPTPRAISHFKKIVNNLGSKNIFEYSNTGCENIFSYDLSRINIQQLRICEYALWNSPGELKFFAPNNPSHVSHSLVNFMNQYSETSPHIIVKSITFKELISIYDVTEINVVKFDIEGAEVEVINHMLENGIFPRQILVEFDELMMPSKKSKSRILSVHNNLLKNNYILVNKDETNFLYYLNK